MTCEELGCDREGIRCKLGGGYDYEETLCPKHAAEAGYCSKCGEFSTYVLSYNNHTECEKCEAAKEQS